MKNERFETVEDLINSDIFCEWIHNQQHHTFWEEWQAGNTKRQLIIKEARIFVRQLSFQKNKPSAIEVEESINKVWSTIKKQQSRTSSITNSPQTQLFTLSKRWRIAASILFLIAASWLTWEYAVNDVVAYATAFGETETLVLPDGSEVILQANSTLKIPKNWQKESTRIVQLEGQAFFKVTKLGGTSPIKFAVQTEDFKVEVLGTQFDVLNRSDYKRVILQEGEIRMQIMNNQLIDLQPNEMVTYVDETKRYNKSRVKATNFTAWTKDKLVLNQTPLSEIARILTDNYGFQVRFSTEVEQGQVRSSVGAIPINNVEDLIAVTEASYEVSITKNGQKIEIQSARGR